MHIYIQNENKESLERELKSCVGKLLDIRDRQKSLKAKIKDDEDRLQKPQQPLESEARKEQKDGPTCEGKQQQSDVSTAAGKKRGASEAGMDEADQNDGTGGDGTNADGENGSSSGNMISMSDLHMMQPVVVTDQLRKEHFLSCLGLVTKAALSELQNKKYTRKRRTTANPHFSNAAIEAKRINQMETAAKREAKKKEMVALRTRLSLFRRSEERMNRHRDHNSSAENNQESIENSSINNTNTIASKGGKRGQASLTSSANSSSKVTRDCNVCNEKCDADLDAIMFCSECRVLFHATCASSVEEITSSGTVPCPKCDKKKSLDQEVQSNSILMETIIKPKAKKIRKTNSSSGNSEMVSLNRGENGSMTKVNLATHYGEKREELIQLMKRRQELMKEWNDRSSRLKGIQENLKTAKDKSHRLTGDRHQLTASIEKLVGFIKSVKIWSDIIDDESSTAVATGTTNSQTPATSGMDSNQSLNSIVAVEGKTNATLISIGKENAQNTIMSHKNMIINTNGNNTNGSSGTLITIPEIIKGPSTNLNGSTDENSSESRTEKSTTPVMNGKTEVKSVEVPLESVLLSGCTSSQVILSSSASATSGVVPTSCSMMSVKQNRTVPDEDETNAAIASIQNSILQTQVELEPRS